MKKENNNVILEGIEEDYGHKPDYWVDSDDVLDEVLLWLKDKDNYCAIR